MKTSNEKVKMLDLKVGDIVLQTVRGQGKVQFSVVSKSNQTIGSGVIILKLKAIGASTEMMVAKEFFMPMTRIVTR